MDGFDRKTVLYKLRRELLRNAACNALWITSTLLRLDMLFNNGVIFNVGRFPYFVFAQPKPLVAVKAKAMSCAGLRSRRSGEQCRLVFCHLFFCFLVGFAVAKAVFDFADSS